MSYASITTGGCTYLFFEENIEKQMDSLSRQLLQFHSDESLTPLDSWPLTEDEVQILIGAIRVDPRTDSEIWKSGVEKIKAAR